MYLVQSMLDPSQRFNTPYSRGIGIIPSITSYQYHIYIIGGQNVLLVLLRFISKMDISNTNRQNTRNMISFNQAGVRDDDPYERRTPSMPYWIDIGLLGLEQHPGLFGICEICLDTRTTAPGAAEWRGSKDITTGCPVDPSENRGKNLTATSRGAFFTFSAAAEHNTVAVSPSIP